MASSQCQNQCHSSHWLLLFAPLRGLPVGREGRRYRFRRRRNRRASRYRSGDEQRAAPACSRSTATPADFGRIHGTECKAMIRDYLDERLGLSGDASWAGPFRCGQTRSSPWPSRPWSITATTRQPCTRRCWPWRRRRGSRPPRRWWSGDSPTSSTWSGPTTGGRRSRTTAPPSSTRMNGVFAQTWDMHATAGEYVLMLKLDPVSGPGCRGPDHCGVSRSDRDERGGDRDRHQQPHLHRKTRCDLAFRCSQGPRADRPRFGHRCGGRLPIWPGVTTTWSSALTAPGQTSRRCQGRSR